MTVNHFHSSHQTIYNTHSYNSKFTLWGGSFDIRKLLSNSWTIGEFNSTLSHALCFVEYWLSLVAMSCTPSYERTRLWYYNYWEFRVRKGKGKKCRELQQRKCKEIVVFVLAFIPKPSVPNRLASKLKIAKKILTNVTFYCY